MKRGPKETIKIPLLQDVEGVKDARKRLSDLNILYETLLKDIETRGVVYQHVNKSWAKNPSVTQLLCTADRIRRLQKDLSTASPQFNEASEWAKLIS